MAQAPAFKTEFEKINYYYQRGYYAMSDLQSMLQHKAITQEEYSAIICEKDSLLADEVIANKLLAIVKRDRISQSKKKLSEWLANNPLYSLCHNNTGAYYTVTPEKQTLFYNAYSLYTALKQAGVTRVFIWNATGQPGEEWSEEECIAFMKEMNDYVSARTIEQQTFEIQVGDCTTLQEIQDVPLNYLALPLTSPKK